MTSRTKKITLAILLLLLLLLFLWLWWPSKQELAPVTPSAVSEETPPPEKPLVAPLATRSEPTVSQAGAEAVARTFAERYGSFSAESHFANVRDLFPLMTSSFQAKEEARIAAASTSIAYYGVSSSVVTLTTVRADESFATIDAGLQRVTSKDSPLNAVTTYETLRLQLVKDGATWVVSDAQWLKR